MIILNDSIQLSISAENDNILNQEKLIFTYIKCLKDFSELLSKKFFDKKILDVITAIYKFLKNCASSDLLRKSFFLNESNIELFGFYLHFFDLTDDYNLVNYSEDIYNIYT